MKKEIVMSATIGMMSVQVVCGVDFPNAGGDIASPSAWGDTLPSTTDSACFKKAGTYTASGNVSFSSVTVDVAGAVFDFTANNAKITMTAGSGKKGFAIPSNNRSATLKGGTWDMARSHFMCGKGSAISGVDVTLTDGVVVTNANIFYWGEHSYDTTCTITGGARVHATGHFQNYATGARASLVVSGGARVTAGASFYTDQYGNPQPDTGFNTVTLTGAGTCLEALGGDASVIGYSHRCNTFTVTDHASFHTIAPVWVGYNTTSVSNIVVFSNGATADTGTFYVGRGAGVGKGTYGNKMFVNGGANITNNYLFVGGDNANGVDNSNNVAEVENASQYIRNHVTVGGPGKRNRMTMRSGGRLSAASMNVGGNVVGADGNLFEALPGSVVELRNNTGLRVGECGNGNECVFSNAAVTAMVFYCGNLGNHGNYLRVHGSDVDLCKGLSASPYDIFRRSHDNIVEFLDGAELNVRNSYFRLGAYSTNNTLRIAHGSRFYALTNTCSIGLDLGKNATYVTLSNRFELLDESYAKTKRFRMMSRDCTTVISNSTFETTDTGNGFQIGYLESNNQAEESVGGNRVEMQGDHPKIVCASTVSFSRNSTLHLQVPRGGYAKDHVLIETVKMDVSANSLVTADMADYASRLGGRITVARASSTMSVNATALAASNALLPEGCSFSVEGKTLYLNVPDRRGTIVIFK